MTGPAVGARIGIVGLGHIGLALSRRLLAAEHTVVGVRRGRVDAFEQLGGVTVATVAELATRCQTVLLALPAADACRAVLGELATAGRVTRTVIDLTSMSPLAASRLSDDAKSHGITYVEAPISGNATMVGEGKAAILVGCAGNAFERNRELLEQLAPRVVHMGSTGAASAVKSGALLMMAVNTLGAAEALALVDRFGVNPAAAIDAWGGGPGSSSALLHRGALMASGDHTPRLGTLAAFRELLSAIEASASTPTRLLRDVVAYLDEAIAQGRGDRDVAAVFETMRSQPATQ